jgi:hypothetical protein
MRPVKNYPWKITDVLIEQNQEKVDCDYYCIYFIYVTFIKFFCFRLIII